MSDKIELQGFDIEVPEEKQEETVDVDQPETPVYGSEGWSDYVLSLFKEDEMFNGNPLCAGLRRVALNLLGDIVSSKPVQVFPSTDANGPGRATVVYEITFNWMNNGELRLFGDVAEVWHGNTDDLFCASAAATACTKAEARVLRKALMVKCLAVEELANNKDVAAIVRNSVKVEAPTNGEIQEEDKMSNAQLNFLDGKCKQLNVDVIKFVSLGEKKYTSYKEVTNISKKTASVMLQLLNQYQNGEKNCPDSVRGYDPEWKN